MDRSELGMAMRGARKALGLSVARASAKTGSSSATIKRWEAGKGVPPLSEVRAYLDRLGLPSESVYRPDAEMVDAEAHVERPIMRLLRAKRRRQGLTLAEVSALTGASIASLYRYETGARIPTQEALGRIAIASGCTPAESAMLVEASESTNLQSSGEGLFGRFLLPGQDPHFWTFAELDGLARQNGQSVLTVAMVSEVLFALMFMGAHSSALEAWGLLKNRVDLENADPSAKAALGLSMTVARLHTGVDHSRIQASFERWAGIVDGLPPSTQKGIAMQHLIRLATGLGLHEAARHWIEAARKTSAGDPTDFMCELERWVNDFEFNRSKRALDELSGLRSRSEGSMQTYTLDVVLLHSHDVLGELEATEELLAACQESEKMFGLGSPTVDRIARRPAT